MVEHRQRHGRGVPLGVDHGVRLLGVRDADVGGLLAALAIGRGRALRLGRGGGRPFSEQFSPVYRPPIF